MSAPRPARRAACRVRPAGNAKQVARRAHDHPRPSGDRQGAVDRPGRRGAHRAARPVYQLQALRQSRGRSRIASGSAPARRKPPARSTGESPPDGSGPAGPGRARVPVRVEVFHGPRPGAGKPSVPESSRRSGACPPVPRPDDFAPRPKCNRSCPDQTLRFSKFRDRDTLTGSPSLAIRKVPRGDVVSGGKHAEFVDWPRAGVAFYSYVFISICSRE